MEKYICPDRDKCKEDCDHKEPHVYDETCTYSYRHGSYGLYIKVNCRPLTPTEQLIADY